ncbi:MAG: 4Fe-4S binding protein [Desulfobulbaceae bacterium]|nr:4Fe-4S binding protein [Desulfobulbaceae bacterium]
MDRSDEGSGAETKEPFCVRKRVGTAKEETRGFQVDSCLGPSGCPNRVGDGDTLVARVEAALDALDLKSFLKARVKGVLKSHHRFRVSISDCPNGCSRPQIVDVGLLGACQPGLTDEPCNRCNGCVESCREQAIILADGCCPLIDFTRCLACGQCLGACPTGTLAEAKRGYRILVGGKLGRHPRLGRELPGIFTADEALLVVNRCLEFYMANWCAGERFGEILNRVGDEGLAAAGTTGAEPA